MDADACFYHFAVFKEGVVVNVNVATLVNVNVATLNDVDTLVEYFFVDTLVEDFFSQLLALAVNVKVRS